MMFRCASTPFATTQMGATLVAARELHRAEVEVRDDLPAVEAERHALRELLDGPVGRDGGQAPNDDAATIESSAAILLIVISSVVGSAANLGRPLLRQGDAVVNASVTTRDFTRA